MPTIEPSTVSPQFNGPAISSQPITARARGFRWRPAVWIAGLALIGDLAVWQALSPDRTMQVFAVLGWQLPVALCLTVWWFFFSRLSLIARCVGAAVPPLLFLLFMAFVRVEGFTGEMLPILSWRGTPTREDQAEQFRNSQPRPAEQVAAAGVTTAEASPPLVATAADWPAFRRDLMGVAAGPELRTDWETQPPRLAWKHPVGLGWSSFAVVGNLAFTQEQRRGDEAVVAYDFHSGVERWAHTDPARFTEAMGGDGPRATPTFYDGRLYTLGATGWLNALDPSTGHRLWSVNILEDSGAKNIEWGMSGSPLVYDDVVVVNPGGPNGQAIVAYDRHTGKRVWADGSDQASYAAPELVELGGQRQLLIFDGTGLSGHDPADGKQLWEFPWTTAPKVNAMQPIPTGPDTVFVGNGYSVGSVLLKIKSDSAEFESGNPHSEKTAGTGWSAEPVWQTRQFRLKFNCPVYRDGYFYGLDEGILTCLNAETGKREWKGGRYGFGQIVLVGRQLLIQAETGEVVLASADPAGHKELARFQALEGKTWNHPVLCRGRLLVRNGAEAACYEFAPETSLTAR